MLALPIKSLRASLASAAIALLVSSACTPGESAPLQQQQGAGRGAGFAGGRGPAGPTAVELGAIRRGSIARQTAVAGVLSPIRTVGVNAQVGGALLAVHVEEGAVVREGQVLAEVDSREVRAQVRSAEAALVVARNTAERSASLYKDRVVTVAEFERDRAAHEAARASLDALRARLGYAAIRAPMSGVVTEKRVEAGDVVGSQSRLFTVADVSTLVVRVQVSELDVTGLAVGQLADVSVDALGGAYFQGKIRRIFPTADSVTRMVPVEIALSGAAIAQLRPGFLARVTVRVGERPNVLLVQSSAVVGSRDARAVFVVKGGTATRRAVRTGQANGDLIELLDGVAEGDSVVIAGAEQVRDGGAVRVVPPIGANASVPVTR